MLQIVFERYYVDLPQLKYYKKNVHNDDDVNVIDKDYLLAKVLGCCTDFVNELTNLQRNREDVGRRLGFDMTVDQTPKYHPEVAGEGVKYSWAEAKLFMRNVLWKTQKSSGKFHTFVRLSTSQIEGVMLKRERIKKFSARA